MGATKFPNGVNNAAASSTLSEYVGMDPTKAHVWFDDFDTYLATDWTITTTEAGAGSATEALATTGQNGGILLITNDDADDDADFLQWATESFKFVSGKKLWFKASFEVSDATQSDFVMGLQILDTTPLAVSDGVYFLKDDGDTNIDFHVEKNGTDTTASAIATVADDTRLSVGFYYDGDSKIYYYVDDSLKGTSVTTNLPDDEELTISFGIQNGEAAAKTMSVDYIFVANER